MGWNDLVNHNFNSTVGWGFLAGLGLFTLTILVIWCLFWKGMALWKAARSGEKVWFVVLLVVNTIGILEILYLYVFSKKEKSVEESENKGI